MYKIYEVSWEELHVSFLLELRKQNTWCLAAYLLET